MRVAVIVAKEPDSAKCFRFFFDINNPVRNHVQHLPSKVPPRQLE